MMMHEYEFCPSPIYESSVISSHPPQKNIIEHLNTSFNNDNQFSASATTEIACEYLDLTYI